MLIFHSMFLSRIHAHIWPIIHPMRLSSIVIISKVPLLVNAAILLIEFPKVTNSFDTSKISALGFALSIPISPLLVSFLKWITVALGTSVIAISALLCVLIMVMNIRRSCIFPIAFVCERKIVPGEVRVRNECLNHAVVQ